MSRIESNYIMEEALYFKTLKQLKTIFWTEIASFIAIFLLFLYLAGPGWTNNTEQNAIFERYAIIVTLIGIPFSLKYFYNQVKKIESLVYVDYIRRFKTQYLLRFLVLNIVIIFNLVGFLKFESQNLLLMSLISFCGFFFCYPNQGMLLAPKSEIDEFDEDLEEELEELEALEDEEAEELTK